MSWYAALTNGTAVKSRSVIKAKVPEAPGVRVLMPGGTYNLVDCRVNVGTISESFSDGPNEWILTGSLGGGTDSLLPWGDNLFCWMRLGQETKFLTYQLNGCGVLVSGTRNEPVVVHANENGENLPSTMHTDGVRMGVEKRRIYDSFIPYLGQTLALHGFDTASVAKWYPGTDYLGLGAVFGVRVSGAWKIYGHKAMGKQSTTTQIWPLDAVADDDDDVGCRCCFITTAVCRSLGRPDDCDELRTLRWFRDVVMSRSAEGRRDVERYYRIAPGIVAGVDRRPDAAALYHALYRQSIAPALAAIHAGDYQRAYNLYRDMVDRLSDDGV